MECTTYEEFSSPKGEATHNSFVENLSGCTNNLGEVARNKTCRCDIGVSAFWATPERIGVNFLPSIGFDDIRVLTHVDNTMSGRSFTFFLRAFSATLWLAIFGLLLVFTALKYLDRRFVELLPPHGSVPREGPFLRRCKYFLLKNKYLYRLRLSFQSTSKLNLYCVCSSFAAVIIVRLANSWN